MKTIKSLSLDEKINLLLYKTYKKEYVGGWNLVAAMSVMFVMVGGMLLMAPLEMVGYNAITPQTFLLYISMIVISVVVIFCSFILLVISLGQIDKKRKKLQVAFGQTHNGFFWEVFDISDDDIKHVERVWKLVKKEKKE